MNCDAFFEFFCHQNPGSGLDPDQDRYLAQNAGGGYGLKRIRIRNTASNYMRVFSGCDHAGLPSPQHCGDVRQLLSRGRTVGGHGVPGGGRPYRHCHQCQVCSTVVPLVYLL